MVNTAPDHRAEQENADPTLIGRRANGTSLQRVHRKQTEITMNFRRQLGLLVDEPGEDEVERQDEAA